MLSTWVSFRAVSYKNHSSVQNETLSSPIQGCTSTKVKAFKFKITLTAGGDEANETKKV